VASLALRASREALVRGDLGWVGMGEVVAMTLLC
jgi:hypothetical protein